MAKKSFSSSVANTKENIEQRSNRINELAEQARPVLSKEDTMKKTFRMYKQLNIRFNTAAARMDVDKGVLLNRIIEEWLDRLDSEAAAKE